MEGDLECAWSLEMASKLAEIILQREKWNIENYQKILRHVIVMQRFKLLED